MTRTRFAAAAIAPVLAAQLLFSAASAETVFDPSVFAQTLATANDQLRVIANQVQQLANQARELQSLGSSAAGALQINSNSLQSLLVQTNQIGSFATSQASTYQQQYPQQFDNPTFQSLFQQRQQALANIEQAVQNYYLTSRGVVSQLPDHSEQAQQILQASQDATGQTAAIQANTQMLGVLEAHLAEITTLLNSQGTLRANETAERASEVRNADAQWKLFWQPIPTATTTTPGS